MLQACNYVYLYLFVLEYIHTYMFVKVFYVFKV